MSDIETAKRKNESGSSKPELTWADYNNFYSGVFSSIMSLFTSVILASILLYICKVAQTNILIDSTEYEPFGNLNGLKKKIIENPIVDINITRVYEGFLGGYGLGWLTGSDPEVFSTKLTFKDNQDSPDFFWFLQNLKKKVIGKTEQQATGIINTTGYFGFFILYIYNILSASITTNLWVFNKVFGFLNEKICESLLLLLFVYTGKGICFLLFILNCIIIAFYCVYYIADIFRDRLLVNNKVSWCFDGRWLFRIWRWLFLLSLFIFGLPIIIMLSVFIAIYSFFIPLYIGGTIKTGNEENQKFNIWNFITSVFIYKKQVISLLFLMGLFGNVSTTFGSIGISALIMAIIILMIFFPLFKSYSPTGDLKLTSGFQNYEYSSDTYKLKEVEQLNNPLQFEAHCPDRNIDTEISSETTTPPKIITLSEITTSSTTSEEPVIGGMKKMLGGGHIIKTIHHYR